MVESKEKVLSEYDIKVLKDRLAQDEIGRDRTRYLYTHDALLTIGVLPEPNGVVQAIIKGEVNYNELPFDEENEEYKGMQRMEQAKIIEENKTKKLLCEALDMKPCIKTKCPLYQRRAQHGAYKTPLCREYKFAFEK